MDKCEILQQIIDNGGSCDFIDSMGISEVCKICPLSKLEQRPNGGYYSCWDSVIGPENDMMLLQGIITPESLYAAKAEEILEDLEIEDILLGDTGGRNLREDS